MQALSPKQQLQADYFDSLARDERVRRKYRFRDKGYRVCGACNRINTEFPPGQSKTCVECTRKRADYIAWRDTRDQAPAHAPADYNAWRATRDQAPAQAPVHPPMNVEAQAPEAHAPEAHAPVHPPMNVEAQAPVHPEALAPPAPVTWDDYEDALDTVLDVGAEIAQHREQMHAKRQRVLEEEAADREIMARLLLKNKQALLHAVEKSVFN